MVPCISVWIYISYKIYAAIYKLRDTWYDLSENLDNLETKTAL